MHHAGRTSTALLLLAALATAPAVADGGTLVSGEPPEGAVALFGDSEPHHFLSMTGTATDWPVEDGALVSTSGQSTPGAGNSNHVVSSYHFRDAEIHVEFMLPENGVGNSGVYIHGNYELQILNSHGKEELTQNDAGAIYGFAPPLVNAVLGPGEWQTYDIHYRAPRRDDEGNIVEDGMLSAWLNGQLVQNETTFGEPRSTFHPYRHGNTPYLDAIWPRQKATMTGPLFLQDHGAPVRFRNVWIRPLDDAAGFYEPE